MRISIRIDCLPLRKLAVAGIFLVILIAFAALGRRSTALLVPAFFVAACSIAGVITGGALILRPADAALRSMMQALDLLDVSYEHHDNQLHIRSVRTFVQITRVGNVTLLRFSRSGTDERVRYVRNTLIKFARRGPAGGKE